MPAEEAVYAEALFSLGIGHPLYEPDPAGQYDRVRVGDVGYVRSGVFFRLFNICSPADHPLNSDFGVPDNFVSLVERDSRVHWRELVSGPRLSTAIRQTGPIADPSSYVIIRRVLFSAD